MDSNYCHFIVDFQSRFVGCRSSSNVNLCTRTLVSFLFVFFPMFLLPHKQFHVFALGGLAAETFSAVKTVVKSRNFKDTQTLVMFLCVVVVVDVDDDVVEKLVKATKL